MAIDARPEDITTEIVIRSWVSDQTLDEAINEWMEKKLMRLEIRIGTIKLRILK
jgi:hypothetical protein